MVKILKKMLKPRGLNAVLGIDYKDILFQNERKVRSDTAQLSDIEVYNHWRVEILELFLEMGGYTIEHSFSRENSILKRVLALDYFYRMYEWSVLNLKTKEEPYVGHYKEMKK